MIITPSPKKKSLKTWTSMIFSTRARSYMVQGLVGHVPGVGTRFFPEISTFQIPLTSWCLAKVHPNDSTILPTKNFDIVNFPKKSSGCFIYFYLENIVYHNLRQLWLVLGVKLMEINSNLFSRYYRSEAQNPK